ncbi:ABC transporter ATP-binding protein [Candidatus Neomarinimicrobiota bacterium]
MIHIPITEPILSLSNLAKSYGDVIAVRDLSIDIDQGEILGFLGPNGAGKTTTINMICGLLKADSGTISFLGPTYTMGLCPQELVIWEMLTCREQLEFVGHQYNLSHVLAKRRTSELLALLGLDHKANRLAKSLSGGMKRRLNIALALVHGPDILILDEPQAGLDPQSRILVREYIQSLAGEMTIILTSHDMDEVDRLAQRIAIIDHGQLLVDGTSTELKDSVGSGDIIELRVKLSHEGRLEKLLNTLPGDHGTVKVRDGEARLVTPRPLKLMSRLIDQCQQDQIDLEDIAVRKTTLEDVFIALTGRKLRE